METRNYQSGAATSAPAAPPSPSNGFPTNGNPTTGTPATQPGAFWFHKISEELRNVIIAAGLTPSDADLTQLSQSVKSRQLFTGVSYYTVNSTLPASDIGKAVFVNIASAGVITLPSAASVSAGSIYTIYNWGSSSFTLTAQASEFINNNNTNPQTFTMQPFSTIILIVEKSTTWTIVGGSGQLTTSPLFGSSIAASGFQKLPSGLILQWGTTGSITTQGTLAVTLPISFPTSNIGVTLNFVNDGGTVADSAGITAKSTTGFTIKLSGDNPNTVFWVAFGY